MTETTNFSEIPKVAEDLEGNANQKVDTSDNASLHLDYSHIPTEQNILLNNGSMFAPLRRPRRSRSADDTNIRERHPAAQIVHDVKAKIASRAQNLDATIRVCTPPADKHGNRPRTKPKLKQKVYNYKSIRTRSVARADSWTTIESGDSKEVFYLGKNTYGTTDPKKQTDFKNLLECENSFEVEIIYKQSQTFQKLENESALIVLQDESTEKLRLEVTSKDLNEYDIEGSITNTQNAEEKHKFDSGHFPCRHDRRSEEMQENLDDVAQNYIPNKIREIASNITENKESKTLPTMQNDVEYIDGRNHITAHKDSDSDFQTCEEKVVENLTDHPKLKSNLKLPSRRTAFVTRTIYRKKSMQNQKHFMMKKAVRNYSNNTASTQNTKTSDRTSSVTTFPCQTQIPQQNAKRGKSVSLNQAENQTEDLTKKLRLRKNKDKSTSINYLKSEKRLCKESAKSTPKISCTKIFEKEHSATFIAVRHNKTSRKLNSRIRCGAGKQTKTKTTAHSERKSNKREKSEKINDSLRKTVSEKYVNIFDEAMYDAVVKAIEHSACSPQVKHLAKKQARRMSARASRIAHSTNQLDAVSVAADMVGRMLTSLFGASKKENLKYDSSGSSFSTKRIDSSLKYSVHKRGLTKSTVKVEQPSQEDTSRNIPVKSVRQSCESDLSKTQQNEKQLPKKVSLLPTMPLSLKRVPPKKQTSPPHTSTQRVPCKDKSALNTRESSNIYNKQITERAKQSNAITRDCKTSRQQNFDKKSNSFENKISTLFSDNAHKLQDKHYLCHDDTKESFPHSGGTENIIKIDEYASKRSFDQNAQHKPFSTTNEGSHTEINVEPKNASVVNHEENLVRSESTKMDSNPLKIDLHTTEKAPLITSPNNKCTSIAKMKSLKHDKLDCMLTAVQKFLYKCPRLADLKWSLFVSALYSYKCETVLTPFPPSYVYKSTKNISKLVEVVSDMVSLWRVAALRPANADPHLVYLLNWLFFRLTYIKVRELLPEEWESTLGSLEKPLPDMVLDVSFRRHSISHTRWINTSQGKKCRRMFLASPLGSFHAVLHHSLEDFQEGEVTLYTDLEKAKASSVPGIGHGNSHLGSCLKCVGICEVVQDEKSLRRLGGGAWMATQPSGVRLRHLLVFRCEAGAASEAPDAWHRLLSQRALAIAAALYIAVLLAACYVSDDLVP